MDEKTPIEKLDEALGELVEIYPKVSAVQKNLLDVVFKRGAELEISKREFFSGVITNTINSVKTIDERDEEITSQLLTILRSIQDALKELFAPFQQKSSEFWNKKSVGQKHSGLSGENENRKNEDSLQIVQARESFKKAQEQIEPGKLATTQCAHLIVNYIIEAFGEQSAYMLRPKAKPWSWVEFKIHSSRLEARAILMEGARAIWNQLYLEKTNLKEKKEELFCKDDVVRVKEAVEELISVMKLLAQEQQEHHENISGTKFFRNLTTCSFTKNINEILENMEKLEKDGKFCVEEYNKNVLKLSLKEPPSELPNDIPNYVDKLQQAKNSSVVLK